MYEFLDRFVITSRLSALVVVSAHRAVRCYPFPANSVDVVAANELNKKNRMPASNRYMRRSAHTYHIHKHLPTVRVYATVVSSVTLSLYAHYPVQV